ncbi:NAD(P)/FAD-dependent oxidoreductase [uncultured Microbulbifer sp.]|uniref:NAD(P)/FAD-dependent oxidoreductase n=1 Tax=uncultured Microbulbifer sp. TaxID=348147 RepID=UPI0026176195|nr:NAD(P)/FAD-dependent oxidoreductase [uncultured Microbulbifer sp.]
MEMVESIVIGAGAIGLASAYALATRGHRVLVLEQHTAIGTEISARSSEVIHAGIYYPTNSLKARACVAGKASLYRFCREHGVPHKPIGKLILATDKAQLPQLKALKAQGDANGAGSLMLLNGQETRAMEPELQCHGAIYSPNTGIFDSHSLLLALQGALEALGGQVVPNTKVIALLRGSDNYQLTMEDGYSLGTPHLVVAAGLHSHGLLSNINDVSIRKAVPTQYLAKGNYFSLDHKPPFSHLIYPLPEPGGLGIHLTLDLQGYARFGPDVEWVNAIDYRVDSRRRHKFYRSIQRYWPALPERSLRTDYAGIRPKLAPMGAPPQDFKLFRSGGDGKPQLVAFFGIESPGLTSCLSLGEMAANFISGQSHA